jgi:oxygen-independent coproporphyrinogen-3 oxidase
MAATSSFDSELIRRYQRNGPRYTSYPTAPQFHAAFDAGAYRTAALLSNERVTPLSLYVHVPFCATPCFYCGCNKVVTRSTTAGDRYVAALGREIELQAALFHQSRLVGQVHFGGGTPTFLSLAQLGSVMNRIDREFSLAPPAQRECSIEIDPRTVDDATVAGLVALGFNRFSLGVQDFDEQVQRAVNRVQSVEQTLQVVESARRHGISAIGFDLIYGLPRQTPPRFGRTLDVVIAARPSRIAVYGYAHMPATFKPQRQIDATELPSAAERLELLSLTVERLTAAGYVYIGMDHFALPEDSLATAVQAGTLHRNFQGYSTQPDCDVVGLGVSSIGKVGDAYAQNTISLDEYYDRIEHHQLAVTRGVRLNSDDRVRRDVIQRLMCQGVVDCAAIERDHCIDFDDYFAGELIQLAALRNDGLLDELGKRIVVSGRGRFLVRNIAMTFDAYLQADSTTGFSQAM